MTGQIAGKVTGETFEREGGMGWDDRWTWDYEPVGYESLEGSKLALRAVGGMTSLVSSQVNAILRPTIQLN